MPQKFSFGFSDTLLAQVGGVTLDALHFDVAGIARAYEAIKPVAERLGVHPPTPKLAGFTYPHIAALGAKIKFPRDSEPKPWPIISRPEEIDDLQEPEDYLAAPLIQQRLEVWHKLKERFPETPGSIGHRFEGPVTTAVLIMGQGFLTLPYDDPERAHKLLEFSARSAANYARAIDKYFGHSTERKSIGMPDDFAGIFPPRVFEEFVVPYWNMLYGLLAGDAPRGLHSELIRLEHIPLLEKAGIGHFDPGTDQYLTPELLREHCPCPFMSRIFPSEMRDLSPDELEARYRKICESAPTTIAFTMDHLDREPNIVRLLEVARELSE